MGTELVCGTGSPACGTGALILSLFSCSTQLPFKQLLKSPSLQNMNLERERGQGRENRWVSNSAFFYLGFFPSHLASNVI